MRNLIILTCLFSAGFCYKLNPENNDYKSVEPYIFEDLINSTIEQLRPNIPDPLEVETFAIDLPAGPDALLTGNASISNLSLSGLQGFQLTALNFNLLGFHLNFTLVVPKIEFRTNYDLDLSLVDTIALYGDGNISVIIDQTELQISVQVDLSDGVKLSNLRIQLQLGGAKFEIHGLLNDEDVSALLSSILNDLVVPLVDENQELITQIISPLFEELINAILGAILQQQSVGLK